MALEITEVFDTLGQYEKKLSIVADKSKNIFILPTVSEKNIYFEKNFAELRDVVNINHYNDFHVLSSSNIQVLALHSSTHILPTILFILGTISINVVSNVLSAYITEYSLKPQDTVKFEIIVKNDNKETSIKYNGKVEDIAVAMNSINQLSQYEHNTQKSPKQHIK